MQLMTDTIASVLIQPSLMRQKQGQLSGVLHLALLCKASVFTAGGHLQSLHKHSHNTGYAEESLQDGVGCGHAGCMQCQRVMAGASR